MLIKQTFESVILLDLFPNSEINIHVQVCINEDRVKKSSKQITTCLKFRSAALIRFPRLSICLFASSFLFFQPQTSHTQNGLCCQRSFKVMAVSLPHRSMR